jgi:ABC-type multidrug transport system ATPase subunit
MAFFHEQDQKILDFLREHLRIEGLDSILFVMREPPWTSKKGDVRFWNARGVVQDFLDQLYDISLAPIRLKERISLGFRRSKTVEDLYLYLPNTEALRELANHYDNSHEFFKALESTYISQLISEVRIRVRVRNADGSLTFHDLSEGEQQLLMVLGLLRFTKEEESLFLLDEPDTHLNPAWSMQYLDFLNSVVGEQKSSHIIMTTHDPLVLASLTKSQVRILRFEEKSDRILVERPEHDPIKMGYAEILTSDIFGLRAVINPKILELLDKKRGLAIKDELIDEERAELTKLNQQLEEFDFTSSVRDPLYKPFVQAMTRAERDARPALQVPILTKEQQEERKRLASEIMRELMEEEEWTE